MVGMSSRAKKNIEALFRFRLAFGGIFFEPVFRFLFANRFYDHRNRSVERGEDFFLGSRLRVRKFQVAIAHVTRFRYTRAYVVAQIPRQMQNQMSHAVSVRRGLAPELLVR